MIFDRVNFAFFLRLIRKKLKVVITARNQVGARLCFNTSLWVCLQGQHRIQRPGGQETWNLCGCLWRPSFLWLICTGLGGPRPPRHPPGSTTGGGYLPHCMLGFTPLPGPEAGTPGTRHPPGADNPPPASVGDTGNKRAVRILLEYYLVVGIYTKKSNVLKRNVLNPRV